MMTMPLSLGDLLTLVRKRIGAPLLRDREDVVMRGHADHLGAEASFTWRFGPGPCFVRSVEAAAGSRIEGADETGVWTLQGSGPSRPLEWGDADRAKLIAAVLSGDWLDSTRGVQIGLEDDGRLRLVLGHSEAALTLDPATSEPRELVLRTAFGSPTWSFLDFDRRAGIALPRRVEQRLPAGVLNRFEVDSITREPTKASAFTPPEGSATWRFDPARSSEVAIESAGPGFLLVTPLIDEREIGAFIFDTGAGANVITPQAAAALALPRVGSTWLGLAAGAAAGEMREARTMRLGPLVIDRPAFAEMDLSVLSSAYGVKVDGIIGYEVLRRSILELEVQAPRLALFDPKTKPFADLPWEPIAIYGNHVYARGRFEGHEGWFRLDTGAPQVPVIWNSPAVERLHLLEGRSTTPDTIGVPGGTIEVAMGEVSGLEIAGHVFASLAAIFPTQPAAAFSDRETLANLGLDCLRPFRVIFDYARRRAAFLKRG